VTDQAAIEIGRPDRSGRRPAPDGAPDDRARPPRRPEPGKAVAAVSIDGDGRTLAVSTERGATWLVPVEHPCRVAAMASP
jgi:hypothetical protein